MVRGQKARTFAKMVGETSHVKVPMSKFEQNRFIDYKTMDDRLQIVRRRYIEGSEWGDFLTFWTPARS